MTVAEIMGQHPGPWTHVTTPQNPGIVVVLDANQQQVQLFTLLDFSIALSAQLSQVKKPAA